MERYIDKEGKKLRYGYTTGSCAAAASKAAAYRLITGACADYMSIETPKGWRIDIEVSYIEVGSDYVVCSVIKDAGDDPDVTNGIEVVAEVRLNGTGEIKVDGGMGVGRVTKKGLSVPVGTAAINPVPMRMIHEEVRKVLPVDQGVTIQIRVPKGEETAKKTLNEKLGIVGGISILGTTGIVEPMSEEALRDALVTELSVKHATGRKAFIYVFGNYGTDFVKTEIKRAGFIDSDIASVLQKTSNFVQHMIEAASEMGIEKILYVGHIGKMVKIAAGMGNTHSKYGDHRMKTLLNCAEEVWSWDVSIQQPTINEKAEILEANTTDEAIGILERLGCKDQVMEVVATKCKARCEAITKGKMSIECVIFSNIYGILAQTNDEGDLWRDFL